MPKFFNRIIQELNSAAASAFAAKVTNDANDRVNIDAGGTITWGSGAAAGDTNLYRSAANALKTDDSFQSLGGLQTVTGAGSGTFPALADGGIAVDTTGNALYFRSGGTWQQVTGGGGGGAAATYLAVFTIVGVLPAAGGLSYVKYWFNGNYTINNVMLSVGTKPIAGSIVVDVLKGTSDYVAATTTIFSINAKPTIAGGAAVSTLAVPDTGGAASVTNANYITIQMASTAATTTGADLVAYVKYTAA